MAAGARVRVDDGRSITLGPGDLVGRAWLAALHIDDPRVSEAHALVSLRGDALRLLALRGRFTVDGERVDETDLAAGQRIEVAPGVGFVVVEVEAASSIVALVGDGMATTALHGSAALVFRPEPALVHPTFGGATAWVWQAADGWRVRRASGGESRLSLDTPFDVEGRTFRLVEVPLRPSAPTARPPGDATAAPLRLVVRYETVHVFQRTAPVVVLDGLPARLVSELAAFAVPVPWLLLAEALWGTGHDAQRIRKRLDNVLGRLRDGLRLGGVRDDLVRANGAGQIELLLGLDDTVDCQL